ncbi:HipA domain-containing protein [Niveibacterium microcysteis]|uniref:HipA domain-containing protein n=1 Tax=Niveibacterium microcysteis TaxID=2811415 RepID=A0ABX7M4Y5_9RHOO|nr:HipA domain-containing protein [Niveibacterium microcysteis]QSI76820.1 HipA domain-containing protein [Niveibacterium microcysteis]
MTDAPDLIADLSAGRRKAVLVKFSSAADNPVARRWASLLVAEHLALQTLAAFGLPASRSSLHEFGGQTFLDVERFDRVPATNAQHPRLGRCGVVSLAALDAAFVGQAHRPRPTITAALSAHGHITPAALPAPLIGTPPALDAWRAALKASGAFWKAVAADPRIEEPVRNAARGAFAGLEEVKLPLA